MHSILTEINDKRLFLLKIKIYSKENKNNKQDEVVQILHNINKVQGYKTEKLSLLSGCPLRKQTQTECYENNVVIVTQTVYFVC